MKKRTLRLVSVCLILAMMFSISAFAASYYSFSKTLSAGKSGYLTLSDTGGSGSSTKVFYPNSYLTVTFSSGSFPCYVNFATSSGTYLETDTVSSSGSSAACNRSGGTIVQIDNIGSYATFKGTITQN